MKISDGNQSRANFPPILSSNSLPDSNRRATDDRKVHRRRTGNPVVAGAGGRRRRHEAPGGWVSGLDTPLLRWKFDDGRDLSDAPARGRRGEAVVSVSARKLAAGLWQLAAEVTASFSSGGGASSICSLFDPSGFEPHVGHLRITFPSYHSGRDYGVKSKDWLQSPLTDHSSKCGTLHKHPSSLPFHKFAMEGATKWNPGYSKTSTEVCHFHSQMKLLDNQHVATVSVVSALQAELVQARTHIKELETERRSSKKKVKHFLRKLGEERTSWMKREQQKVLAIVDDLKHELNRERRNCQRMEIVNSKLLTDLADAKLSAKEFMQDYEKERKTRELLEEVCHDLVKKIEEDKTEVESLKRESTRLHEEVEEERKMLQMAEVWREERVQMKLADAKLIVEQKYCQMNNLIADLETFLRLREVPLDMIEMSEAEVIRRAVGSVDIQGIKEFSYTPPESNDIYTTIDDLHNGEAKEKEIGQYLNYRHASDIHTVSPEFNNKIPVQKHSNGFIDHDRGLENSTGWETVTNAEDQGSSFTPNGSNCSVNRIGRSRYLPRDVTEHEQNAGQKSLNSEISEICLVSVKQPKKKASSLSKLWRSRPSNGDVHKTTSVERNARLSIGSASNKGSISPDEGSIEGGLVSHDLVGQWRSPDLGNPHITRGMKGCVEWPEGIQRYSLKAKHLEARVENQKAQLCKRT